MERVTRSAGHTGSHAMVYHPRDSCCSKAQVAPSLRPLATHAGDRCVLWVSPVPPGPAWV